MTPAMYSMTQETTGLAAEVLERLEECGVREDTGLGYMEFFDWYAECDVHELARAAQELLGEDTCAAEVESLCAADRYKLALRVWGAM